MTYRSLLFASSIVLAAAACQDEPAERVGEAAEDVTEAREDVRGARQDLAEERRDLGGELAEERRDVTEDLVEERAGVAEESAEHAGAQTDFAQRRDELIRALRMEHDVYAAQAGFARGLLADPSLPERARQQATDKLLSFERELNEARQAIDSLAVATAPQWESAVTTAEQELQQLETAHDETFEALSVDRERIPQT